MSAPEFGESLKKEVWRCNASTFSVEVVHWTSVVRCKAEGPHRWNVYANLSEKHPRFALIKGHDMWQPAANALPLHRGCTWLERSKTRYGEEIQVGSDYSHLYDDCYTHAADETHAAAKRVFTDALELFDFLLQEEIGGHTNEEPVNGTPTVS